MKSIARPGWGAVLIASIGMFGLGSWLSSESTGGKQAVASTAEGKQTPSLKQDGNAQGGKGAPARIDVGPPPSNINDLSMEVSALRTLYLMSAWPDHGGGDMWMGIQDRAKETNCVYSRTDRKAAVVSAKYGKLLTELRAAYIAGQDERIIDLTEQLEDLTEEEEPAIDDALVITAGARKMAPRVIGYFTPERLVNYLYAYGKDFPDPMQAVADYLARKQSKGEKPTAEARAFLIKEVSWQLGGLLDQAKQKAIADKLAKLLDKADAMTNEEREKAWRVGGPLRHGYNELRGGHGPMEILRHVLEQDVAELLANPRLLPALDSRIAYLKKAGYNMERVKYDE